MAKANSGPKIAREHQPFVKVKTGSNQETTHYSVFYEGIPERFRQVAERELNETGENRRECLRKLKEALRGSEFVEDDLLLAFLRNKKFNVNKAEAKLRKFIAKRRELAKMLAEMDMDKIEAIVDDMGFGFLPYRDKHGRHICYSRPDGICLEKYSMREFGLVFLFATLLVMKYPLTTIDGLVYFCEIQGERGCFHLYYEFVKGVQYYFSALFSFPIRVPRVEMLHTISAARWLYNIVRPVLSNKIIGRITFHGDSYKDLHKHFSPDILPDCFGGTMGPLSNIAYRDKLLDFLRDTRKEYS